MLLSVVPRGPQLRPRESCIAIQRARPSQAGRLTSKSSKLRLHRRGSAGHGTSAGKIDVIVWAGLSRRPPQNAKSLRPRQLKRRSKKDLRPRGRFWAQGPQVVPSHLGNPIAENLDPRHGDSDIAPVLRQSFILLAMFETFADFAGLQRSRAARERRLPEEFKPHLKRTPRYADRRSFGLSHISSGRLGTPIGGHMEGGVRSEE